MVPMFVFQIHFCPSDHAMMETLLTVHVLKTGRSAFQSQSKQKTKRKG